MLFNIFNILLPQKQSGMLILNYTDSFQFVEIYKNEVINFYWEEGVDSTSFRAIQCPVSSDQF